MIRRFARRLSISRSSCSTARSSCASARASIAWRPATASQCASKPSQPFAIRAKIPRAISLRSPPEIARVDPRQETGMIEPPIRLRTLSAEEAVEQIPALADILLDCVEGGASVSFMAPFARDEAEDFWLGIAKDAARGERVLIVAEDSASGELVGTAQLVFGHPENQPHRADVAKVLVHRRARGRGAGAA